MWKRTGLFLTFSSSLPCRFPLNDSLSSRSKSLLQGTSWSHCILIANKSSGRTVRDPVKVYLPGDPIPDPRKRNRITSPKGESSKAIGNYYAHKEPSESQVNSKSNSEAIKSNASNVFHETMSETANVRQRKLICLEGQRLVEEGFKAGLQIHKLFLRKTIKEVPSRLANFVEQGNVPVFHVTDTAIKNWSTLTTPPGIVGVFRKPKAEEIVKRSDRTKGMPVTVICDNIREPGNLGSILRSAAGAGCEQVLLSKGCCDPWESKVLRSGCGAQFYMPVTMDYPLYSLVDILQDQCNSREKNEVRFQDGSAIGSCDEKNGVGIRGDKTSAEDSVPSFALFLADSNDTQIDERKSVPVVAYTDVDYRAFGKVYLAVGGETEGLSSGILQITAEVKNSIHSQVLQSTAARLRIPLCHNMESLNSSSAFSVIVYEMLRQFQSR